jgi:hypothetical protein
MHCKHIRTCNLQYHSSSYLYNVPAEISSGGSHVNNRLPFLTRLKLAFLGGLRAVDEILTCNKKQERCSTTTTTKTQASVVHAPKHQTTVKPPNTTTIYPFLVTFVKRHEFSISSTVHAPQDRFVFPHFVHKRRQGQTNGEWQRTGVGYPDWHRRVAFTGGSNGRRGRRGVGLKGPFVGQFGIFVHATRCHIHDLKQSRTKSTMVSPKQCQKRGPKK